MSKKAVLHILALIIWIAGSLTAVTEMNGGTAGDQAAGILTLILAAVPLAVLLGSRKSKGRKN